MNQYIKMMGASLLSLVVLGAISTPVLAQQKSVMESGEYSCKISKEYKMRDCKVSVVDGVATLSIPTGLVAIHGEVHQIDKQKNKAYFYGKLSDARPFGCYSCNEKCAANPETCMCKDIAPEHSETCAAQRVGFVLTKKGKTWTGKLPLQHYNGVYKDGKIVGHTIEVMMLDVVIKQGKPKDKKAK